MILKWVEKRRAKIKEMARTEMEESIRQHIRERYHVDAPLHHIPELISMAAYTRYLEGAKEIGREVCN